MKCEDVLGFNEKVGRNIRFLRRERGLSVEDLAKLSHHVTKPLVSKIETFKHKKTVDPSHIDYIARGLKVTTDVILESNPEITGALDELEKALTENIITDSMEKTACYLLLKTSDRGPREQVRALLVCGGIDYVKGGYDSSAKYCKLALKIAEYAADHSMVLEASYHYTRALFMLGHYSELHKVLDREALTTSDHYKNAKSLLLKGLAFAKEKNWESAIEHVYRAVEEAEYEKYRSADVIGRCFQALGGLYRDCGLFVKSLEASNKSLLHARECSDKIGEIYSLKTIGEVYIDANQPTKALEYLYSSLEEAKKMQAFRKLDILKIEFCISVCNDDYHGMRRAVLELKDFDLPREEKGELLTRTARKANENGQFEDAIMLYESAVQALK